MPSSRTPYVLERRVAAKIAVMPIGRQANLRSAYFSLGHVSKLETSPLSPAVPSGLAFIDHIGSALAAGPIVSDLGLS